MIENFIGKVNPHKPIDFLQIQQENTALDER